MADDLTSLADSVVQAADLNSLRRTARMRQALLVAVDSSGPYDTATIDLAGGTASGVPLLGNCTVAAGDRVEVLQQGNSYLILGAVGRVYQEPDLGPTGITQEQADARYVNASGDSMTGPLVLPGCRLLWPTLSVAVPSGVSTRLQAGGATPAYWWGAYSVNGNNDGIVSTPRSGRYLVAVSLQCTAASTVTWTAGFGTWDGPTFGWGGSATGTSMQRPVFAELCYLTAGTSYCGYVYAGGAGTLQAAKLSMSYIGN